MTQSQNPHTPTNEQDEHLSDTSANVITLIALAVVTAVVGILYFLAQVVSSNAMAQTRAAQMEEQIVERLRPVAGFEMGASSKGPKTGEEVYNSLCTACHAAGVAGAPKMGDAGAWGARIAQGQATLFKHAIEGFTGKTGVMPAKGGNPALSDLEVERAVVFMANKSGGSLAEPAAPAADGAAPADGKAAPAAGAAAPAADPAKK